MRASELLRKLQEIIETYHGDPDILMEDGFDSYHERVNTSPTLNIEFKRGNITSNDYVLMRKTRH